MAKREDVIVGAEVKDTIYLTDFIDLVRMNIEMKMDGVRNGDPSVRVSNLWCISNPGIGKSQRFQNLKDELGCEMKYVCCSNLQQGDLSGIPVPIMDENGNPSAKKVLLDSIFPAPPKNKEEAEDMNHPYNKPGFIFFDEIGNTDLSVRSELLAYCDGTVKRPSSKYRTEEEKKKIEKSGFDPDAYPYMPPAWIIVAAGNNEASIGESNFIQFGYNVRCRFETYNVVPDMEGFKDYMSTYESKTYKCQGFHPMVITYLEKNPGDLSPTPDYVNGDNIANPRNWECVSNYLRDFDLKVKALKDPKDPNRKIYQSRLDLRIPKLLGPVIGEKFLRYQDYEDRLISPDVLATEKIEKKSEYKKVQGEEINVKLMMVNRAIDYITNQLGELEKKEKKYSNEEIKKKMFLNLLDNTEFIFNGSSEEYLSSIVLDVLKRKPGFSVDDLSSKLKRASIDSIQFNK